MLGSSEKGKNETVGIINVRVLYRNNGPEESVKASRIQLILIIRRHIDAPFVQHRLQTPQSPQVPLPRRFSQPLDGLAVVRSRTRK